MTRRPNEEPQWQCFLVDLDEGCAVATVTLRGTANGNAMGGVVFTELPALVAALAADPRTRVIVLRGAGADFSVGLDLRWYLPKYRRTMRPGEGLPQVRAQLLADAATMQTAISAIGESRLPVIAAIHGSCVGAALDLVSACDIRIASADAFFSLREVHIGLVADLGSLQRLPRIIGAGHTRELALTGRDLSATEAQSMGLVTRVLPTPARLFEAADELARQVAVHPPHVVAGIRQVLDHTLDLPLSMGLRHVAVWNAAFLPSPELPGLLAEAMRAQPAPASVPPATEPDGARDVG
jgi:enoyl-CoA hydratase/carnithine racemase